MGNTKVTIITACYNRVQTIEGAIESVLSQDYEDIEYIVVDGGSTDGTIEVLGRYRDKLTYLISEPDNGMYEAINKGIRLASGDVIGLLHSDDMLNDSSVISQVVDMIQKNDVEMLYGDGLFMRGNRVVRNWVSGRNTRLKLRLGWLPLHTTCYVRRSVYSKYGIYNERYKIAADTEWLFRMMFANRIKTVYLHRYIVKMQMGGLSTSSARRRMMWHEDVAIFRSFHLPGLVMKVMKMMWKIPQFLSFYNKLAVADKTVSNIDAAVLQLVRSALWHNESLPSKFRADMLSSILQDARQQAVAALVSRALLDGNIHSNDDGALEIMSILVSHQRHAAAKDTCVAMIASVMEQAEIPYLIFKGQVAARYYPEISLRSTGDIDVAVPRTCYERAKHVIESTLKVPVVDDKLDKHAAFFYENTRFEIHHRVETFGYSQHQALFDKWISIEMASPRILQINDKEVHALSPLMDILVIFKHLFNHLLVEGVGLRQVCDLALALDRNRGIYDETVLAMRLRQIGYYRGFKALGALMVDHIGLPQDCFPFELTPRDSRWGRIILKEILSGGNFGKYGRDYHSPGLHKSLETAWIAMRHCLKFMPLAPIDILFLIPRRIGISFRKYV